MNKFLITLVAVLSFAVAGVANAEMTMSGSLSQFVATGDKVDGGVTSKFNRMTFGANTTTDNGWTVVAHFLRNLDHLDQVLTQLTCLHLILCMRKQIWVQLL